MAPAPTLQEFAHKFIQALETLNLDRMIALRLPECVQQIYPASMEYLPMDNAAYFASCISLLALAWTSKPPKSTHSHSPWSKEAESRAPRYRGAYEPMLPYFRDFKATIHGIVTDTLQDKVVIHASSKAATIAGPYNNEYMFILHLNEAGTQLKMVEEYVDSFRAKEQNWKLRAAIAESKKEAPTWEIRML